MIQSREQCFPEETDTKVRLCQIYLQMEPPNQQCAKIPSYLVSDSLRHWSILCVFNNRKIKYDLYNAGLGLRNGEIWPKWKDMKETSKKSHETKCIFLGTIITSPHKIYELASQHEMNGGTFHATKQNCQLWALHLIKSIDVKLYIIARLLKARPLKERKFAVLVRSSAKISNFMHETFTWNIAFALHDIKQRRRTKSHTCTSNYHS